MLKDYLSPGELGEDFENIIESVKSGVPTAVFGLTEAAKCHLASVTDEPILYIAKDSLYAAGVVNEIEALSGEKVVYLPAKDDVLLYKTAFDRTSLFSRLSALYKIKNGARIVVTTFPALLQLFPKDLPVYEVKKGGCYDLAEVAAKLIEFGYKREEFAEE